MTTTEATHYSTEQWAEFARGHMNWSERETMRSHLNTGCEPCREAIGLFARAVARGESCLPDYALQCAQAIYILQRPRAAEAIPGFVAKLVYDSFNAPPVPGIRASQGVDFTHELAYEAGSYHVDLQLQRKVASPETVMLGQILDRERPSVALANVPVLLLSGRSVLSRVLSNELGEFIMQCQPTRSLQLYVILGNKRVEVHLGQVFCAQDVFRRRSRPLKGECRRAVNRYG